MTHEDALRLKLTLHYDGTHYFGWQVQPDAPTVQGAVEEAVARLLGAHRTVLASGRTDRGVHATGQVASVDVPPTWTSQRFRTALNAVLPRDVWVEQVQEVGADFHPRFHAQERTYAYRLGTSEAARSPFVRPYCWALGSAVHRRLLDPLAEQLLGEHSFKSFAKSGQPERGDRCVVTRSEWRPWGALGLEYWVAADRFLHHMVRYLVGTMVTIARGKRPAADLTRLLDADSDLVTSSPAPAEGLYLVRVRYPGDPGSYANHPTPSTQRERI